MIVEDFTDDAYPTEIVDFLSESPSRFRLDSPPLCSSVAELLYNAHDSLVDDDTGGAPIHTLVRSTNISIGKFLVKH